jgi:Na+-translocating ferredoxin:NAD+ oxidoreductase RnfD subunit
LTTLLLPALMPFMVVESDASPAPTSPEVYIRRRPALGHSGMTVNRYFGLHAFGAMFTLTAGLLFYGWRAVLAVGLVVLSAAAALRVWRHVGLRGGQLRYSHVLWLAFTLGLMLPVHLAAHFSLDAGEVWPILPLAGFALVIFCWLLGGIGAGRIHPVVVTYLALTVLFGGALIPRQLLQRNALVTGNVMNSVKSPSSAFAQESWRMRPPIIGYDAIEVTPPSEFLAAYTTGQVSPDRAWLSLDSLLRDRMPPLEDLIMGATPGPIGTSSAIAVIIGGLFLLYRGLIDYRIPLLIISTTIIALLILPIPWQIRENPQWRWAVGHVPGVGWPVGITLANYEILASPLLFMAFFLATSASARPLTRRGRTIYSIMIGFLTAVFQLYVSVSFGSYLALMTASLLTPAMDKWFCPRTLI